MSSKRVKPSPPSQSSDDGDSPDPASLGSVKDLLQIQQSLLKCTVQQLHLLPKFNALFGDGKTASLRNTRTATQFNLLLSMRESLLTQQHLSAKGRIAVTGSNELLGCVEASLAAMANLELKGSAKLKSGFELSTSTLDDASKSYMEGLFTDPKLTIDQWNAAVMKGISHTIGSVIKSPIELAGEVRETSDKVLALYRPTLSEGLLAKRPELSQEAVACLYEDTPMTHQILKDLLKMGRAFQAELTEGIQFGNTERFLRERQMRKSVKKEKPEYSDHKNRRIKFDVHEKIADFMPSVPHPALMENREQILRNLFGKASGEERTAKAAEPDEGEYFQDVALI